jgi:dethiobiotin synthetase
VEPKRPLPPAIAVVGTAMDSGKTQSCAYLAKGLSRSGARVGYAKVTGTGAGGDYWLLRDAGADPVLDFTDAGHVSTYLVPVEEIEEILILLTDHLAKAVVDAIVLEIADGVLQPETAGLLMSSTFRSRVGGVLFAARDSMGAAGGESWLRSHGLPIVGLSGVVTASPLERQEAQIATGLPVYSREDLGQPDIAMKILGRARQPIAAESASGAENGHARENGNGAENGHAKAKRPRSARKNAPEARPVVWD